MMNGAGSVRHEPLPAALVQPGVKVIFNDGRWSAVAPDTTDRGPIDAALAKLNADPAPSGQGAFHGAFAEFCDNMRQAAPALNEAVDAVFAVDWSRIPSHTGLANAQADLDRARSIRCGVELAQTVANRIAEAREAALAEMCDATRRKIAGGELALDRESVIAAGNYSVNDDGHAVPLYAIEFASGEVVRAAHSSVSWWFRRHRAPHAFDSVVALWYGDERFAYAGSDECFDVVAEVRARMAERCTTPHTKSSTAAALSSLICRAEAVLNDLRALKATL